MEEEAVAANKQPRGYDGQHLTMEMSTDKRRERVEDTNVHIQQMNAGGEPPEAMEEEGSDSMGKDPE